MNPETRNAHFKVLQSQPDHMVKGTSWNYRAYSNEHFYEVVFLRYTQTEGKIFAQRRVLCVA